MCDQIARANKNGGVSATAFLKPLAGSKTSGKGDDEDEEANHTCHRHWAFALYKKGDMAKACKLIKKAI